MGPDDRLGTIALPDVEEGWDNLWPKTVKAFQYVWEHHRDEADWFVKADDDTWIFMDNLRSTLGRYDANRAHYLGHGSSSPPGQNWTYHFGGTGKKKELQPQMNNKFPFFVLLLR